MLTFIQKYSRVAICSPAVIILAAFGVRAGVFLWIQSHSPVPFVEHLPFGHETGNIARAVAAGEGFSSPLGVITGPTAWLAPAYPLLLASVFRLFGIFTYHSFLVIVTINCIFSAFTGLPIYKTATKIFGEATGVVAGWMWVFLPTGVYYPIQWVWDTSMGAMLFGMILWATLIVMDSRRPGGWAGYGVLLAVGALTNPSILSTYPFLLLCVVWRNRVDSAKLMRLCALAMLTFTLSVSPWIVRNYLYLGKPILFKSTWGVVLWLGNNEAVVYNWDRYRNPLDNAQERESYQHLGESAYMAKKQREAISLIATNPRRIAGLAFARFVRFWTGASPSFLDDWLHAPARDLAIYVWNFVFPFITLLGLLYAFRTGSYAAPPLAFILLVFPLVYYVTISALRYRHPIDPVMTVLAAFAMVHASFISRSRLDSLGTTDGS